MTEKSYFHNGTSRGDALLAPYSDVVFGNIIQEMNSLDGYVIPQCRNGLEVSAAGAKQVTVNTGSALVDGVLFSSDAAEVLALEDNPSAYDRIDRVIIQINWIDKTADLKIKNGKPNIIPLPPELVQESGVLYEVSLARLYIPSGYAGLNAYYAFDERQLINTADHQNLYGFQDNIMFNSEFIGAVGMGISSLTPPMWGYTATIASTEGAKFDDMTRGSTVNTTITTGTLFTTIRFVNNPAVGKCITIAFLIEVLSGEVYVNDSIGVKRIKPTNGPVKIILRRILTGANPIITLTFSNASQFKLGQITACYGLVEAPMVPKRELILSFGHGPGVSITSASFPYSVSLDSFPYATRYAEAGLFRLQVYDTGSAATATAWGAIQDTANTINYVRQEVGRLPNNAPRIDQGMVPIITPSNYTPIFAEVNGVAGTVLYADFGLRGLQT